MFKKSISIILIFAFTNYILISCSTTNKVDIPAINIVPDVEEKIIELILPDGQVIQFNENGARFRILTERIKGTSIDGKDLLVFLHQGYQLRVEKPKVMSKNQIVPELISEIILKSGEIIIFDDEGCRYNDNKQILEGMTIKGKNIKFSIVDVKEIRTGRARIISLSELMENPDLRILEIVSEQTVKTFDENGGKFLAKKMGITGISKNGIKIYYNIEDVLYIKVERTDWGKSCLVTAGCLALGAAGILLIALLLKESCPFVYSYNGKQYVFDAEPLGGAISEGLKKTDFSKLEHLQPVNDIYRLIFRNEVEEIQYLDEVKLLIIDHDPAYEVTPDMLGNYYLQKEPIVSISAQDENGLDLSPFINKKDDLVWQTHLPVDSSYKNQSLRHELTFEFPKPTNAKYAKLMVNAGTALWGSNMIREMIQMRGEGITDVNNHGTNYKELYDFISREELYLINININYGKEWKQSKHYVSGNGPLITEDRIIPLDVSNVSGDKLQIRLNPPIGFWTLDYLAVEYKFFDKPIITEISPNFAIDQDDEQILESLQTIDQNYCQMLKVGDWFTVEFDAPILKEDLKRSIFLKTFGYYEIQIDKTQPENTELIQYLMQTPNAIIEYSMDEYLKWRENLLTSN